MFYAAPMIVPAQDRASRQVGTWLLLVSAAVVMQVVLGGITRLTDSGLSITEWKPLLGVIPPLDEAGWNEAFARYQQIPQYIHLKRHLGLQEFKFIYFWEWMHRLWGRLLGVFFGVPALVFWRRGMVRGLERRLAVLFVLGGAQGALGWFMVASGLQDLLYVSHLRLAAHFMLAVVLLVALWWTALEQWVPARARADAPALQRGALVLLGLLGVQLTWGAFMAGLKAALAAPTWPTINGMWVPGNLLTGGAWWDNPLAVHFVHRGLAYVLVAGVAAWWWRARIALGPWAHAPLGLVVVQVTLGVIVTVYSYVPDALLWVGATHQLVAVMLTCSLVAAVLKTSTERRV